MQETLAWDVEYISWMRNVCHMFLRQKLPLVNGLFEANVSWYIPLRAYPIWALPMSWVLTL